MYMAPPSSAEQRVKEHEATIRDVDVCIELPIQDIAPPLRLSSLSCTNEQKLNLYVTSSVRS